MAKRWWAAINRGLIAFFYDKDAFTYKGFATLALQLLGLLGILLSTRLFSSPPDVEFVNAESVGCLDLAQYEESFTLRTVGFPERLQSGIDAMFLGLHLDWWC